MAPAEVASCWSGGTGRRTGLKIPRSSLSMWVRPPPPALFCFHGAGFSSPPAAAHWNRSFHRPAADLQQLNLEDECRAARDSRPSAVAVRKIRRTNQLRFASGLHLLYTFRPALDYAIQRKP